MDVPITVTASHISTGHRAKADSCPIALAIHDNGFPTAMVFSTMLHLEEHTYFALPTPVREWISNFDNYRHVEPFTFDLAECALIP